MRGDWRQHEVWDGTYTFDDLVEWHDMAIVKDENERRIRDWNEMMSRSRM